MSKKPGFKVSVNAWPLTLALTVVIIMVVIVYVLYSQKSSYEHGQEKGGYLGATTCARCHGPQFRSWQKTRMASSFEALRPNVSVKAKLSVDLDPDKDYTHDQRCLHCHTTGLGAPGGFVSIEETPGMAGVGCEACHGSGGSYVGTVMDAKKPTFSTEDARRAGLVYPPTEGVCRSCHNEGSPFVGVEYVFNYEERVKRGTHQHFQRKHKH